MITILLGPPGAGKGTQAKLLADRLGMEHVSTGDLLRSARSSGTLIGKQAADFMDQGLLVPDELVAGLVAEKLNEGNKHFLLDGFPRNLFQAEQLSEIATHAGQRIVAVLLIEVPVVELVKRLAGRGRADDSEETVRRRLEVYDNETQPLIKYFADLNILTRIEGTGAVEAIHGRILDTF